MTDLDLEQLRLGQTPVTGPRRGRARVFDGTRFLCGPIPMPWLDSARALPGRAIHVAIEIWHWRFIKKSMTVKINLSRMGRFGVTRPTASRGLQALESAGLVRVERGPGRAPVVTIIDIKPKAGAGDHADD
jgi:hypothetical protein